MSISTNSTCSDVVAPMIQINWQESDLKLAQSTRTTTTPSPASSVATVTSSSATQLSTGAIVGIAIGSLVLLVSILAAGWIWRRRRRERLYSSKSGQPGEELKPMALPAQHLNPHAAVELQGSSPETGELSSMAEPRELS